MCLYRNSTDTNTHSSYRHVAAATVTAVAVNNVGSGWKRKKFSFTHNDININIVLNGIDYRVYLVLCSARQTMPNIIHHLHQYREWEILQYLLCAPPVLWCRCVTVKIQNKNQYELIKKGFEVVVVVLVRIYAFYFFFPLLPLRNRSFPKVDQFNRKSSSSKRFHNSTIEEI